MPREPRMKFEPRHCEDCLAYYTGEHTCPPWLKALLKAKKRDWQSDREDYLAGKTIEPMKPSARIDKIMEENYPGKTLTGAIIDFLDEKYEKEHTLDGLKELEKQHNKNLKKQCKYCGTSYQDPKYCSVWGRTADKHVFEDKCELKECEGYKKGYADGAMVEHYQKKLEDVSERNALIDELVVEIERLKLDAFSTQVIIHRLKSKKK